MTARARELVAPRLDGELVSLRPWLAGDEAALEPACGDDGICRFTTVPRAYSAGAARAWIVRQEERRAAGEAIVLAIRPRASTRPVGMVGLFGLDTPDPCARLGYWLVRAWRGRGLARDAAMLLAAWGFRELGVRVLHLDIELSNAASIRLAEGLGAQPGDRRDRQLDGRAVALCRFALTQGAPPVLPFEGVDRDESDRIRRSQERSRRDRRCTKMAGMDEAVQGYIDGIAAEHRPLFDRLHRLILAARPDAVVVLSYKMPTYKVGRRRLHVGVWKHGLSIYGWQRGRSDAFLSRHPELKTSKGTLQLRPEDAAAIPDDELSDLVRAALDA